MKTTGVLFLRLPCGTIMILTQNSPIPKKYTRIVSLVPSQTELLFSLGLNEEVAGITKFCVHPAEWFKNKAKVGGTKNVHTDAIHQLSPDLIIANKEENIKEQIELLANDYDVLVTDVNTLAEALQMIQHIGSLTGRSAQAQVMTEKIYKGFKELLCITANTPKLKAAYFIWKNPYMVAGGSTFINDMLGYCGIENIFYTRARYPQISLEEIHKTECQLILLSSEPYPFKEKHKTDFEKEFPHLKIFLADGEMFGWYGSRLIKSIPYFKKMAAYLNNSVKR